MTQHNVEFNQSEDENGTDMHCLDIEFIKKYLSSEAIEFLLNKDPKQHISLNPKDKYISLKSCAVLLDLKFAVDDAISTLNAEAYALAKSGIDILKLRERVVKFRDDLTNNTFN
ncbi:hypothetical protein [Magnetovibrio blakemorei]|uniref:Uncharacterized protein n=1 Tax=Magnetovibrio blakemorei TaxID=28181 RepID=A0A1E5Q343_9PROT|nr:hypothetical protein [Magnetovibrio blakemorei]OEJ63647.1 hypothetical protein BEN30_01705 [Magnetovibrio blakemorei]